MSAQTQSQIQRAVDDLQSLKQQWDGVESVDKEREKAQARLDAVKQNTAAMRTEFSEIKRAHDDILRKAHEEQAELEKLQAEVKRKSKALAEINAELAKLPDKLRGFDKFVAELRLESDRLTAINDGLNGIRVEVGA